MKKKSLLGQLRATTAAEDRSLEARFEKAELALLKPTSPEKAVAAKPDEAAAIAHQTAVVNTNVVRESFSLPKDEADVLRELQQVLAKAGHWEVTRSQVIRAAIELLSELDDSELIRRVSRIERIRPGRK